LLIDDAEFARPPHSGNLQWDAEEPQ